MNEKTVLIVGGFALAGVVILMLARNSSVNAAANRQIIANQAAYVSSPAGQVNGILSGVGSFFNSGALNSLRDAFSSTGGANDPGLIDSSDYYLNDPGLEDY